MNSGDDDSDEFGELVSSPPMKTAQGQAGTVKIDDIDSIFQKW